MRFHLSTSASGRFSVSIVVSLLLYLSVATYRVQQAEAFYPTRLFTGGGISGRSHTQITHDAIEELDKEFFSVTTLTKSMEKAISEIEDANAGVDSNETLDARAHADAESFPEAQSRLLDRLQKVKVALASEDASAARSRLGEALHTLQDFYSHSNWIELGNNNPHPDYGRVGGVMSRLGIEVMTCVRCDFSFFPPPPCRDCTNTLVPRQVEIDG